MPRAYTEKRKASNKKWDEANLKRMSLAVSCDRYERMKEYTMKTGESINGFVNRAIDETIKRETMQPRAGEVNGA